MIGMTRDQARLMDKLLRIAHGSVSLVEEAFANARAEPGEPPTFDEIVCCIMERQGCSDFVARVRQQKS